MSAIEVVPVTSNDLSDLSLDQLAAIANEAHEDAWQHVGSAVLSGIRAGRALAEAHDRLREKRSWESWCREHVGMNVQSASRYERLAAYADRLPREAFEPRPTGTGVRQPTINHAMKYVAGLPPLKLGRPQIEITADQRREIHRLRGEGASLRDIAGTFGVSTTVIYRVLDPESLRENQRRHAERKREYLRLRRLAAKQRELALVKTAGGDLGDAITRTQRLDRTISDAYAQTRQLEQIIGRITPRTHGARRNLDAAQASLHRCEDALVRVLKASDQG